MKKQRFCFLSFCELKIVPKLYVFWEKEMCYILGSQTFKIGVIIMHICEIVQINLFAGQEYRRRCRRQTHVYSSGRGRWMNWEIRVDIYTLPCIK